MTQAFGFFVAEVAGVLVMFLEMAFQAQDIRHWMHLVIPGKGRGDLGSSRWGWPIPGMVGIRPPERNVCILGCGRSAFLGLGAAWQIFSISFLTRY